MVYNMSMINAEKSKQIWDNLKFKTESFFIWSLNNSEPFRALSLVEGS